eukprot:31267-Pelagococcus_subviridis.AAC.4
MRFRFAAVTAAARGGRRGVAGRRAVVRLRRGASVGHERQPRGASVATRRLLLVLLRVAVAVADRQRRRGRRRAVPRLERGEPRQPLRAHAAVVHELPVQRALSHRSAVPVLLPLPRRLVHVRVHAVEQLPAEFAEERLQRDSELLVRLVMERGVDAAAAAAAAALCVGTFLLDRGGVRAVAIARRGPERAQHLNTRRELGVVEPARREGRVVALRRVAAAAAGRHVVRGASRDAPTVAVVVVVFVFFCRVMSGGR